MRRARLGAEIPDEEPVKLAPSPGPALPGHWSRLDTTSMDERTAFDRAINKRFVDSLCIQYFCPPILQRGFRGKVSRSSPNSLGNDEQRRQRIWSLQ
jgi:hypothetical protein